MALEFCNYNSRRCCSSGKRVAEIRYVPQADSHKGALLFAGYHLWTDGGVSVSKRNLGGFNLDLTDSLTSSPLLWL